MQNVGILKNKYLQGIIIGIFFLLIGICFILHSINNSLSNDIKQKTYIETDSIVVDYDINEKTNLKAVIVEYEVDGNKYKKISDIYTNVPNNINVS